MSKLKWLVEILLRGKSKNMPMVVQVSADYLLEAQQKGWDLMNEKYPGSEFFIIGVRLADLFGPEDEGMIMPDPIMEPEDYKDCGW